MPDRNDELLAVANQRATQEALTQIKNDIEDNETSYYEWLAAGRYRDAGQALRNAHALADEARRIAGAQQAQRPQSQYTQAEMDLMRDYPDEIRRNWNTALAAANNLVASKRRTDPEADLWAYRNSREYIQGIAHACGVLNSDGTESNEGPLSPNMVCEICKIDTDTYNRGVQRLIEDKRAGKYPMGQS